MNYVIKGRAISSILKFEDLRIGEVYRCVNIHGESDNIMYMRIPTCLPMLTVISGHSENEEMNTINLSNGLFKRHVKDMLVQRYDGIIDFKEEYFQKIKETEIVE